MGKFPKRESRGWALSACACVLAIVGCDAVIESNVDVVGGTVSALTESDCPPGSNVIVGTSGDDVLVGTNGDDCILGLGGDDVIDGGAGDDFIAGGPGADTIHGENGSDQLFGESGDDIIDGGRGADVIDGGDGNDTINGANGDDTIDGGAGNDIIDGANGDDTIEGGAGNDVIVDSRGADSVDGGAGSDACGDPSCEEASPSACSDTSDCADPGSQTCVGGACVYCQTDALCTDTSLCTGVETCIPAVGCQPGIPLDYGVPYGLSCRVGRGACRAEGDVVCDGAGTTVCTAVAGAPTPDNNCNDIDDDCDGATDEDFLPLPTECGVGECRRAGLLTCEAGGVVLNSCTAGAPAADDICDGLDNDCDGVIDEDAVDSDGDGFCDPADSCPFHARIDDGVGDLVRGTVLCQSRDDLLTADLELPSLPIATAFGTTTTDCGGRFEYIVPASTSLEDGILDLRFSFEGWVPGAAGVASGLRVTDDIHVAYGTEYYTYRVAVPGHRTTESGRRILTIDPIVLDSSECELWRVGTDILEDYHQVRGAPIPSGRLQLMRRGGTFDTAPYVFYDYVDLAANILDVRPNRDDRETVLFHEAGHVIRHVLDGNLGHWLGDLVASRYGRCHIGTEISEEEYAFNEGWGAYWAQARRNGHQPLTTFTMLPGAPMGDTLTNYCGDEAGPRGLTLTADHVDWVEDMVADRLLEFADCIGAGDADAGDRALLTTLEANPGSIHTLFEFETALCAAHSCCGLDRTTPPADCPPTYTNDGLTCRGPDFHVIQRRP